MTPSQQHRVRPPPRTLRISFRPRGLPSRVAALRRIPSAAAAAPRLRPRRQVRTLAAQRRNHPCNLLGSAFRQAVFCRLWVFESRPQLPRIPVTVSSNSRVDDECRACATRMRRFPASSPRSPGPHRAWRRAPRTPPGCGGPVRRPLPCHTLFRAAHRSPPVPLARPRRRDAAPPSLQTPCEPHLCVHPTNAARAARRSCCRGHRDVIPRQ